MCKEALPENKRLPETPDFLHMLSTLVMWFQTPAKKGKENSLCCS